MKKARRTRQPVHSGRPARPACLILDPPLTYPQVVAKDSEAMKASGRGEPSGLSGSSTGSLRLARLGRGGQVVDRAAGVAGSGSIGKLDIAALIAWKRLRANTGWVKALMSLPDVDVRAQTASAVYAAQDLTRSPPEAAVEARAALTGLPGMGRYADAVASTLCFVASPSRMVISDSRAHHGLTLVGLELNDLIGRYGRYM